MKLKDILKLYPTATIADQDRHSDSFHTVFDGEHYLEIPKDDISPNELTLLEVLFAKKLPSSQWYQYLVQEIPIHNRSLIPYTVIQFHTTVDDINKDMYLLTLSGFFESLEDVFFVSDHEGLLVTKDQDINQLELEGFINTLDDDFSSKTSLYIGEANHLGEEHIANVKEERKIFKLLHNPSTINTFKTSYQNALIKPVLNDNLIAKHLLAKIQTQSDYQDLIMSLWKNQVNLSKTSQDLFIHRNTLNYRLDKFFDEVGLSLRDLDDLLICYLAIL